LAKGFDHAQLSVFRFKRVADIMSDQARALRVRAFSAYLRAAPAVAHTSSCAPRAAVRMHTGGAAAGARGGLSAGAASLLRELALQVVQHLVAGQHLRGAGVRLAPFADGGEELAVL